MNEALFVDVSTLNVVMMCGGKFCVSMNYSSCPEKIALDAQALGGSFDVYLSMWPRTEEEGDVEIEGLRAGSVPFYAIKEEVRAAFALVERIPGVNNVFLCNALANTVYGARVENFQTVLCYGNRYLYVEVEDRKPRSIEVFANQHEFMEEFGDDYTCYGDLDLVDADAIRAQYTELAKWKRSVIIPLCHLILASKTRYNLPMETVRTQMAAWVAPDKRKPVTVPKKEVVEEPVNRPTPVQEVQRYEHKVYGRVDWLVIILSIFVCICTFCVGGSYRLSGLGPQLETYAQSSQIYIDEGNQNTEIKAIYDNSFGMAGCVADIMTYARASELAINVTAVDAFTDRVVIQFNTTNTDLQESFSYYMGSRYTVAGVNQYGSVGNTDGTTTYEYGITLLYAQ